MRGLRFWALLLALGMAPAIAGTAPGVYSRTITETGTTAETWVTLYGAGRGSFDTTGSLGGGTLTVERPLPDGTVIDISDGGYTDDVLGYTFDFGGCTNVRVKLTGATSPSVIWSITPEFYKPPTPQSPDCSGVKPE